MAQPPFTYNEWRATFAAELAKRHDLPVNHVREGVLTRLFIRGLEPAKAAEAAKVEYQNRQVRPKGWGQ